MPQSKLIDKFKSDSFSLNSIDRFNEKKKNSLISFLTSFGVLLNIIWFLSVLINPPIAPLLFIEIGGLSLLVTFIIKFYYRFFFSSNALELQSGGSIVGFVITWVLVQYYSNQEAIIENFNLNLSVNVILNYYLILVFLIWFVFPTGSSGSQDLIFNLPPLVSYFILNFWKLDIIVLFLSKVWNSAVFGSYAGILLLIICIIELIGMFQRQYKIDITAIILDLSQLARELIEGPVIAVKWTFLLLALVLLGLIQTNLFVLAVIGFSIFIGFISLTAFVSKLTLNSGLIERKSKEVQSNVPKIFSDLKEFKSEDIANNYFQVVEKIEFKRNQKVKTYYPGDTLFRLPLKGTLESLSGIYVAKIAFNIQKKGSKRNLELDPKIDPNPFVNSPRIEKTKTKNKNSKEFQFHSVDKFSLAEWNDLINNNKIVSIPSDKFVEQLGFSNMDEFNATVEQGIQSFSKVQDGVRDRIRGVPSTWEHGKTYNLSELSNGIPIPQEILNDLKDQDIKELEIIPGKDEYLWYIKKKN